MPVTVSERGCLDSDERALARHRRAIADWIKATPVR